MSNLQHILFKDFITLQRGFDLPKKDMVSGPYPVVGSTSIIGYHSEYKVMPPGVVTGRSGSLGEVQYIREKYWPHNTSLWVRDFKGNFPRYVYYFLKTLDLKNFNSGVGVPTLNRNDLDTLEIAIHDYPTQHKISSILSAYDDLIENNTRRRKILEEMAEAIYKEWFVNFRFPGHENVKMVNSELGKIPEGWKVGLIGDLLETLGGGTPSTENEEYWKNGEITWYTPTDITSNNGIFIQESSKKITRLGLEKSSAKMFPPYCVMMTSRATIGEVAINTKAACTNQGFITCIPSTKLSAFYLYFWVKQNKEIIISLAGGATYKEINRTTFRKLPILKPSESGSGPFECVLNSMFKQIENLQTRISNLRRSRDLLLPKLVRGDIDVEDFDIGEVSDAS